MALKDDYGERQYTFRIPGIPDLKTRLAAKQRWMLSQFKAI